jgi:arylsulfatase
MTDDCGFGAPSTFGGVIPTPALDRIAKNGLRYTNFHSTSLCSPTRAALITGRNHHVAGNGVVGEIATGFPGYNSVIRKECGTIGEILKQNGYATSWFGKNHNTPSYQSTQAGPFDQWPVGMGFEYFYGFVGGDASQWQPNLYRNTTPIYPFEGNPGWNLTTAMADEAIGYMKQIKEIAPEKPFLVYYVPGGTHSPHHPTKEWVKKISDMHLFDEGWNKIRETIFANQKRLGIMPRTRNSRTGRPRCPSGTRSTGSRRSSSSNKRMSMAPTSPIPTTRSAGSSRPWRTSGSSTTHSSSTSAATTARVPKACSTAPPTSSRPSTAYRCR